MMVVVATALGLPAWLQVSRFARDLGLPHLQVVDCGCLGEWAGW